MLSKCVQCGFYIRKNDEFCLNCGLKEPTKDSQPQIQTNIPLIKLLRSNKFRITLAFLITLIILLLITNFSLYGLFFINIYLYFVGLALGFSISFLCCYIVEKFLTVKNAKRIKTKNNLSEKIKVIDNRIKNLSNRISRIDVVLEKVCETSNQNLSQVKQKLLSAREIAFEQFSKYKLQKNKIELVRLQNQVLPYSLYFNRLDEFRTEEAVIISEQTIREVGKIREDLAENFSNKDDFEFKNFMRNLDETSNGCEKLWEALLNKQAMFALKDVQPLENLNTLPQTNELAHAIETFNIESTLNDFSESFEQLETEYKRLLADNEVSQKLLNYEN